MSGQAALKLYDEFVADWEAALGPCVTCALALCPPEQREHLRRALDDYLQACESPPYSPVQQRRLRQKVEPIMARVFNHPSHLAWRDQQEAMWRDVPLPSKLWRRLKWRLYVVRLRVRLQRRPARWE